MNPPSRWTRTGLVVLAALSVGDVLTPLLTDGTFPPVDVALGVAALGVLSLVLVALAWRGSTAALVGLVVLRLLSALAAVPVFFVEDVPAGVTAVVATSLALTVVGVVLVLMGRAPAGRASTAVAR
jgi:hypothetical protein